MPNPIQLAMPAGQQMPTQQEYQNMAGGNLSQSQLSGSGAQGTPPAPSLPPVQGQGQGQQNPQPQQNQPGQQQSQSSGTLTQLPNGMSVRFNTPPTPQDIQDAMSQLGSQNQQSSQNQTLQTSQQQTPTDLSGNAITNATDASMYQQKIQNWQQQNANAASGSWLGQLINGIARTGRSIGLGLEQDAAKVGNAIGLSSNLDPNSAHYNPLLDTNSATAQAFQQLVAKGQTGWEKAGKTVGDIGSFLVPGAVGEIADAGKAAALIGALDAAPEGEATAEEAANVSKLLGKAKTLDKVSTLAKIAGGNSEALAPYTTGLLSKVGLAVPDAVGEGLHLTQGGNLANSALANLVAGTGLAASRSGKTSIGDIAGGAALATGGNAILGGITKYLQTPAENLADSLRTNPEVMSSNVDNVKDFFTKTMFGKNGTDGQVLNKFDLSQPEYESVLRQASQEGNLPSQAKGIVDTAGNAQNADAMQKVHGQVIGAMYDHTPGTISLQDTTPGANDGIVSNVVRDIESNPQRYKQFLLTPGGREELGNLPDEIQKKVDVLNGIAGKPAGSPATPSMMHDIVMNMEHEANKNLYGAPIDPSDPKAVVASSMRRALATTMKSNADLAWGDEVNPATGNKFADDYKTAVDKMNLNYKNEGILKEMYDKPMQGKKGPGSISQLTKHTAGLIGGIGGAVTGLGGGSAGLGAGGYLAGTGAVDLVGQPISDFLTNSKLGTKMFGNLGELSDETASTSNLQKIMRDQQATKSLDSVLEYLKKNKK